MQLSEKLNKHFSYTTAVQRPPIVSNVMPNMAILADTASHCSNTASAPKPPANTRVADFQFILPPPAKSKTGPKHKASGLLNKSHNSNKTNQSMNGVPHY